MFRPDRLRHCQKPRAVMALTSMRVAAAAIVASGLLSGGQAAAAAADIPDRPEEKLFAVDKSGLPRIADEDKAAVAQIAASKDSPPELRGRAIQALAVSGYSPESADALLGVVMHGTFRDRGIAAMGLRNFTTGLSPERKETFRKRLREVIVSERGGAPVEVVRTLLAWGDAPWLAEELGDRLTGHALEIEILEQLPAEVATPRLFEMYRTSERDNSAESYNWRANLGRALLKFGDKRGVDVLDTLLDAKAVPASPDGSPYHQYRANVFADIRRHLGQNFGYEHPAYDPSLDAAIARFREQWFDGRERFQFPE